MYFVWSIVGGKRLGKIMSAVLNYLRYKETCHESYSEMKVKIVSELIWLTLSPLDDVILMYVIILH